jgi:hypothetical protein
MTRFLKLTSIIFNTNHIHRVTILPNQYEIHMMTYTSSATIFGVAGTGFGGKSDGVEKYIVSSNDHPTDYKKVSDWLESVEKQK